MTHDETELGQQEDILVVDDTLASLKLLTEILSRANYRVRPATDGELALRSVRAQAPAMILLDVRMPGMDGYEVCRRLKTDATTRSIPVVFISALGEEGDKVRGFQVGGVDYLTKPFQTAEVLARVHTHLALRRAQSDLETRNAELRAAYEHLEERVRERTAELQQETDEHRRTSQALRESEQRFRVMAEAVPDILFTNLPDGHVDYVNSRFCHYTGLPAGSGMGYSWADVLPADERSRIVQLVMDGMTSGEPIEFECQLQGSKGAYRWFVVRSRPIHDDQGQLVKWFGTCTDIHDLRTAKEELQGLNELLEQRVVERTALAEHRASQLRLLAAELAEAEERERRRIARVLHDQLQQILVVARMKVKLLRDHCRGERLHSLSDEVDHLLNHALDESRSLTASLSPPVLYDRGLEAGLQWLARQTRDQWGLSVDLRVDNAAEPTDLGLRILLFQAVRELLLNVSKHARAKNVHVELTHSSNGLMRAAVTDDGVGFDPATIQSSEIPGGFGLFSIRERLDLVGGSLQIDSAPGRGTRVVVSVPRSCGEPTLPPPALSRPPVAPVPKSPPVPSHSEKIRILVADDHAIVRQGLTGMLGEHAGFEVVGEAADGLEAVELALACRPDTILMDVSMPKLSGMEATRRIVEALPNTRVIGLSMHEAEDMAAAMLKAGAIAYLRKDTHAEILFSTILHHMADARVPTSPSH